MKQLPAAAVLFTVSLAAASLTAAQTPSEPQALHGPPTLHGPNSPEPQTPPAPHDDLSVRGHSTPNAHPGAERDFFEDAAQAGLAEVAAGRVAAARAQDPRVRHFAQQMIKDHTKANHELAVVARKKHLSLPHTPDDANKQALAALKGKHGEQFDRAYIEAQLTAHQDAVRLFESAAKSPDQEVSALARRILPVVKQHLEMLQALRPSG